MEPVRDCRRSVCECNAFAGEKGTEADPNLSAAPACGERVVEAAAALIERIQFPEGIIPLGIEGRKIIARAVLAALGTGTKAPTLWAKEDELTFEWPDCAIVSFSRNEASYSVFRDGEWQPGRYALLDHPIEAAKEINSALSDILGTAVFPEGYALVPLMPSRGLLISMAVRDDHAFLLDRDPSNLFAGGVEPASRESTLRSMAQLYEEAIGRGFYSPEREQSYVESFERAQSAHKRARGRSGHASGIDAHPVGGGSLDVVSSETMGTPGPDWKARAEAAEAALALLKQKVERKDEALWPFAEFADDMDLDRQDLRDEEGIYAFKAGDFRIAREALHLSAVDLGTGAFCEAADSADNRLEPGSAGLGREHTWHQPACAAGDTVVARMHQGPAGTATVSMVETHYRHDRSAYHTYLVVFEGHRRGQWLGDGDILSIQEPDS